jgi:hypothetical protein
MIPMPAKTREFLAELAKKKILKWKFAKAQGISPTALSIHLREETVPDEWMTTLRKMDAS